MHETITALSTAHFALTDPRALRVGLALLAPIVGAGTVPFANVGNALLVIANTIKLPFAAISYIMAGGGQALHLPQARSLWVGATILSVRSFSATIAQSKGCAMLDWAFARAKASFESLPSPRQHYPMIVRVDWHTDTPLHVVGFHDRLLDIVGIICESP